MSKHWLALLVAGFLLMTFSKKTNRSPRGIRNHNPGNIRENENVDYEWQGERLLDTDADFEEFQTPQYGIRAIARILASYNRRGVNTISSIIATWAPPVENDTVSYIRSVVDAVGLDADDIVFEYHWPQLIAAMIYHENGQQPYSLNTIQEGIDLA